MTGTQSRWFEYGEPTDGDRVEATVRTTYATGPNETREDDVERGTVAMSALDLLDESDEIREHTHDDGSVLLSALDGETERELLATFESGS